jgi:hypothetical protein
MEFANTMTLDEIINNLQPHWGDLKNQIKTVMLETNPLEIGETRSVELVFDLAIHAMQTLMRDALGIRIRLVAEDENWTITLINELEEYPDDFSDHSDHLASEAEYFHEILTWLKDNNYLNVVLDLYPSNSNKIWIYIVQNESKTKLN